MSSEMSDSHFLKAHHSGRSIITKTEWCHNVALSLLYYHAVGDADI